MLSRDMAENKGWKITARVPFLSLTPGNQLHQLFEFSEPILKAGYIENYGEMWGGKECNPVPGLGQKSNCGSSGFLDFAFSPRHFVPLLGDVRVLARW